MSAANHATDELLTPPTPAPKRKRFSLDDLLGDTRPQAVGVTDLPTGKEIRLDRITGDPNQPRRTFDGERLVELADSIRIEGVLQPIVVRYDNTRDIYVIVHGERRWRAAQTAGLSHDPGDRPRCAGRTTPGPAAHGEHRPRRPQRGRSRRCPARAQEPARRCLMGHRGRDGRHSPQPPLPAPRHRETARGDPGRHPRRAADRETESRPPGACRASISARCGMRSWPTISQPTPRWRSPAA